MIGHHEPAFVSGCFAPGILDFVTDWLAIRIQVNTRDNHSMRHSRLVDLQPVRFREAQSYIKGILQQT